MKERARGSEENLLGDCLVNIRLQIPEILKELPEMLHAEADMRVNSVLKILLERYLLVYLKNTLHLRLHLSSIPPIFMEANKF